jgi:hypothetical protein
MSARPVGRYSNPCCYFGAINNITTNNVCDTTTYSPLLRLLLGRVQHYWGTVEGSVSEVARSARPRGRVSPAR